VTRTPLSRSKDQRSPGRFTQRGLNAQGGCSGQRGNVFGVGKYCYLSSARRRARCLGAHGGRRGAWAYCVATRTACYYCVCVQAFQQIDIEGIGIVDAQVMLDFIKKHTDTAGLRCDLTAVVRTLRSCTHTPGYSRLLCHYCFTPVS